MNESLVNMSIRIKVPISENRFSVFEEEINIPFQRIFSDEPVKIIIDKVRERIVQVEDD